MEKELLFLQRVIRELHAEAHHAIVKEQYDLAIGLINAIRHFAERRDYYLQEVRFALVKEDDDEKQE